MIIDGKLIARRLLRETKERAERLARTPSFGAITIAPSRATESYLRIKERQARRAGISMDLLALPEDATTASIIECIERDMHDAVIVQLPLPSGVDTMAVLSSIPPQKDADVLSPKTREGGEPVHPIARAVDLILKEASVPLLGKKVLVVGQGWLVGAPVTAWLAREGAQVVAVTRETGDVHEAVGEADIVISGAGVPGLVRRQDIREGAVVIDVGTSELSGGIAGDADPDVAERAAVFTPVPGGVGPIAVACLMDNVVSLAESAELRGDRKAV